MNKKKSKIRATLVFAIFCLCYIAVMLRLPDKVSMTRTSDAHVVPSNSSILPLPNTNDFEKHLPTEGAPSSTPILSTTAGAADGSQMPHAIEAPASAGAVWPANGKQPGIEPSLLISVPVICHALKEGWLDRDSLIFAKKDAYNNVSWRKPLEILRDHDTEGIRNILNTIGQKRVLEFMKREAICPSGEPNAGDLLVGKGYTVRQEKLVQMYEKYVGKMCDDIFPFTTGKVGITKGPSGEFRIVAAKPTTHEDAKAPQQEWMMPNLSGMTMRAAIDQLTAQTPNIKVRGYGIVVSQSPRPFERLRGETACTIEGKGIAE